MQREDWDKRYAAVENLWAVKPNRFLVAEVEGLTPGRALDLACGEGQNAIWLASLGWSVVGVDYSEVAISKGRDRAERDGVQVELVCADLVSYRPELSAFDLVLVLYLHIPAHERRGVLERAAAALARLRDGRGAPRHGARLGQLRDRPRGRERPVRAELRVR